MKNQKSWEERLFEMVCAYNRSLDGTAIISDKMAKKLESFIRQELKKREKEVREEIKREFNKCLYGKQWVEIGTPHNFEAGRINITDFEAFLGSFEIKMKNNKPRGGEE